MRAVARREPEAAPDETLSALLVLEPSGGGSGRHVLDLAAGLRDRGHRVTVAWSPVRAEARFADAVRTLPGIAQQDISMRAAPHPSDARALRTLRGLLAHGRFDVVHGHSSKAGALVRIAARAGGPARVYTPHCFKTMDPTLSWPERRLYGAVERALGARTDALITVSPEEARHARAALGIPAERLHTIANGVAAPRGGRAEARARLGLRPEAVCAGFLGRLAPQKAPLRLIEIARALPESAGAVLAVVGDGPMEDALRRTVESAGLSHRFAFAPGSLGADVLAGFDLFVMTSAYEGLPYTLLEAAAAGLPIVTTDVGGARTAVVHGRSGFIVPNFAPEAFAQGIARLACDAALRAAFAVQARARAQDFTLAAMLDGTLAAYAAARARSAA